MKIMKSAEDYLEMMLMLQEKHGYIRSVDIAAALGVSKPSVSYAAKRLRENGYISMADDSRITLLPKARRPSTPSAATRIRQTANARSATAS